MHPSARVARKSAKAEVRTKIAGIAPILSPWERRPRDWPGTVARSRYTYRMLHRAGVGVCTVLCAWGLGCGGRIDGGAPDPAGGPTERAPAADLEVPQANPLPRCTDGIGAPADRPPSQPQELVRVTRAAAVGVDDRNVFFASAPSDFGQALLQTVPKTGGAARPLAPVMAYDLVVDDDLLYLGSGGGAIATMGRGGGELRYGLGGQVFSFALDRSYVYTADVASGAIQRMRKDRTDEPITLARGNAPQGMAVRGNWVYWANYTSKNVARAPIDGGEAEIIEQFSDYTRMVVVDCNYIYVAVGNYGDEVWRKPLQGGPATLFARVGGTLRIDAESLYVQSSNATWRVSLATGKLSALGKGHGGSGVYPSPLTLDDDAVYWTNGEAVVRADK